MPNNLTLNLSLLKNAKKTYRETANKMPGSDSSLWKALWKPLKDIFVSMNRAIEKQNHLILFVFIATSRKRV